MRLHARSLAQLAHQPVVLAVLTASTISFLAYTLTLAPSITLEHAGSLIVAGDYLGVGRVPGYPLWHLLAFVWTRVFSWATYHGAPNVAGALNLMSAFFGAISCGMVAGIVGQVHRLNHDESRAGASFWSWFIPSVAVALVFAFGRVVWSQAVVAETHMLTCCMALLTLFFLLKWMETGRETWAWGSSFWMGLSLSQSQVLVLMGPVFLLAMCWADRRLCLRAYPKTSPAGFLALRLS